MAHSDEIEGVEEHHGFCRSITNISGNSVILRVYNMKYYFITSTIIFINNSQVDVDPFRYNLVTVSFPKQTIKKF